MTRARIAGLFYLVTFITGVLALVVGGRAGAVAGAIAGASYIAVTVLFYLLFAPIHRGVSLVAACVSFAGIIAGFAGVAGIPPLVFFGVYCLLIGYLALGSDLPRYLGVLMVVAGLGWLTFLSPQLTRSLYPYNLAPGMLGEGLLTAWLLVVGRQPARVVDEGARRVPGAVT